MRIYLTWSELGEPRVRDWLGPQESSESVPHRLRALDLADDVLGKLREVSGQPHVTYALLRDYLRFDLNSFAGEDVSRGMSSDLPPNGVRAFAELDALGIPYVFNSSVGVSFTAPERCVARTRAVFGSHGLGPVHLRPGRYILRGIVTSDVFKIGLDTPPVFTVPDATGTVRLRLRWSDGATIDGEAFDLCVADSRAVTFRSPESRRDGDTLVFEGIPETDLTLRFRSNHLQWFERKIDVAELAPGEVVEVVVPTRPQ